jgi:hypothetical protein
MSPGPFFFGDEATTLDAVVFGALATSILTPIESPIRDFMRAEPRLVAYTEGMQARLFPELTAKRATGAAAPGKSIKQAVHGSP